MPKTPFTLSTEQWRIPDLIDRASPATILLLLTYSRHRAISLGNVAGAGDNLEPPDMLLYLPHARCETEVQRAIELLAGSAIMARSGALLRSRGRDAGAVIVLQYGDDVDAAIRVLKNAGVRLAG